MTWLERYGKDTPPTPEQIRAYIVSPLWDDLNTYLQTAYDTQPKYTYSCCTMQPGWNVKYQKGGKALATLYPMDGFFIAMVVVGQKEKTEAELLLPSMSEYTQTLYARSGELMGARWLMTEVTDADTLEDVKRLIAIRRPVKAKKNEPQNTEVLS